MNWTHPICLPCYSKRYPGRGACTVNDAGKETCCDCGKETYGGIYFRADPRTLAFPHGDEESKPQHHSSTEKP